MTLECESGHATGLRMIEEPPGSTDLYEIIDDYRETRWDRLMMWPTIFLGVILALIARALLWFNREEEERTIRNLQG